jgi:hypothetical protein
MPATIVLNHFRFTNNPSSKLWKKSAPIGLAVLSVYAREARLDLRIAKNLIKKV